MIKNANDDTYDDHKTVIWHKPGMTESFHITDSIYYYGKDPSP